MEKKLVPIISENTTIQIWTSSTRRWEQIDLDSGTAIGESINPEEPYIEEMRCFLEVTENGSPPEYSLENDIDILRILEKAELSDELGEAVQL